MSTIDQKAYLQKYLAGSGSSGNKKKKKKSVKGNGLKIIDDDIDLSKLRPLDGDELDILGQGEDAPQVAGIIDERPEELRQLEDFKMMSKWRVINQDDGFNSKLQVEEIQRTVTETAKENTLIFGKMYSDSEDDRRDSDLSPPRKSAKLEEKTSKSIKKILQSHSDSDFSPPRRDDTRKLPNKVKKSKKPSRWSNNEDIPQSRNSSPNSDISPPRKKSDFKNRSVSQSPPRKTSKYNRDYERSTNKHRDKSKDFEFPQRKSRRDLSHARKSDSDFDISSPRRRDKKSHCSPPSPEISKKSTSQKQSKTNRPDSDFDISPPRRRDISPPRRRDKKSHGSPSPEISKKSTSQKRPKTNRQDNDFDISSLRRNEKKSHRSPPSPEISKKSTSQKQSKTNRPDSDFDISPRRRDISPPRRSEKKSRRSPPSPEISKKYTSHKHSKTNRPDSDFDISPPRRRDISPPNRRDKKSHRSSLSPEISKKQSKSNRQDNDFDISPPRRSEKKSHRSLPSPEINKKSTSQKQFKTNRPDSDFDISPPRRRDISPPRRKEKKSHRSSPSPETSKKSTTQKQSKTKRQSSDSDMSPPRRDRNTRDSPSRSDKKMSKTLEGKNAGLRTAEQVRLESESFKRKEEVYMQMPDEITGRNAQAVSRKRGKRETSEDRKKQIEKTEKQKELNDKYQKWGKGLKQTEEQERRVQDYLQEASKPLARAKDDRDLEKILKAVERDGDPMLEYMREKDKQNSQIPERPTYKGSYPPNRFNIRPGYRWDGVDRSNGYEKKLFDHQSSRKAQQEEIYKWSTEDL